MTLNPSNHLLRLLDWDTARIHRILDAAAADQADRHRTAEVLKGQTVAMYFEKASLRTITTFQVGIHQLGGQPVLLDPGSIGLGKRESIEDVSRCLGRWVKALVVRCYDQKLLEALATWSGVPVINALSDSYHPCQALALGLALKNNFSKLQGLHVVFVGDGNNVATDIAVLCARLGIHFTLACPAGYTFDLAILPEIEDAFGQSQFRITHDPVDAVKNADLIYTDVWTSMGQEAEKAQRLHDFKGFQVNEALLAKAPKHCKVSHCLPAHRGEEITDGMMESPANLAFDEAENRLHVQKAVLRELCS
jgi:ornithine carbamoyltransferase